MTGTASPHGTDLGVPPWKARRRIGLLPVALRQRHGRRMTETEPLAPFHRRLRSGDIHTPYWTHPTSWPGGGRGVRRGGLWGRRRGSAAARALDPRAWGGSLLAFGEAPNLHANLAPSD